MGKKKYNYQAGDTFIERIDNIYHKQTYFTIHHIITIENEINPYTKETKERFLLLSISIDPDGKFKNRFHRLRRPSLNGRMRHGIAFQEFCEEHKLEFLILTGKTIHEIVTEALERHKKYQWRYFIDVNPEQINIKSEEA